MLETTMRREAIERRHIQDASDDTRAIRCFALWIEMREASTKGSTPQHPIFTPVVGLAFLGTIEEAFYFHLCFLALPILDSLPSAWFRSDLLCFGLPRSSDADLGTAI
jgi:hypothetical protein